MKLTLADVERCLGGMAEEGHDAITINAVRTDSRTVEAGDLFFCIDGDNFDGHEFAAQAAQRGAAGVVVSRIVDLPDTPVTMVRDTTLALGKLAGCWRTLCDAKLVAVTGTAGKTTVKEMLHTVLSQAGPVAKNYRNFNNQIGLPLSMLKATADQPVWVMELGISVTGDMEELAPVAMPDIAVITNCGPGHLQGLGDEAGVVAAKTVLLKHLREGGQAIINRDCRPLWDAACDLVKDPIGFSTDEMNDTPFVASFLGTGADGWGRFRLRTPESDGELSAPFSGEHFAENLACVAAVAYSLGMTWEQVADGVQAFTADPQRFCCKGAGDALVIDDTYNANPLSMARSIATASEMAGKRPLVLVLGDMRELGAEAVMRHQELGRHIREADPVVLFYKGEHFRDVISGLGSDIQAVNVAGPEDFLVAWRDLGLAGPVVLVKGSRSLKMEELADGLCKALGPAAGEEETIQ